MAPAAKKDKKMEKTLTTDESGYQGDGSSAASLESPVASSSQRGSRIGPSSKKAKGPKKNPKVAKREDQKKRRSKKAKKGEFSIYIHKVMKQVHPELTISTKCMSMMNSFANDMFDRFASEAARLVKIGKSKTMSSRDVQTAVRLLLPGELAKHAVSEGAKAVQKFHSGK